MPQDHQHTVSLNLEHLVSIHQLMEHPFRMSPQHIKLQLVPQSLKTQVSVEEAFKVLLLPQLFINLAQQLKELPIKLVEMLPLIKHQEAQVLSRVEHTLQTHHINQE